MIEEKLENLKKDYIKTRLPDYLIYDGWRELSLRLETRRSLLPRVLPKTLALIALMIFISAGVVTSAQAAKPGQALYPIKILSENVYAQVTGNQQFKIERRAQEVIETSDNGESFDEAIKLYEQTIDEAGDKSKDAQEEEKERLREKLEEQEKLFQEAQEQKPQSKKRLEEILERTRRTRGEVKGQKDKKSEDQNNEKGKNGDNDHKDDDDKDKDKENHGSDRDK